jgi:Nucleotidyl transferase AbiEii toxin, Type IV TA system
LPKKSIFLVYGNPSAEELRRRATRFGFTSIGTLEHLRWDYEFVAQLQALDPDLVLRGGAATQLYLDLNLQRGSVDVDLITSKTIEQVRMNVSSLVMPFSTIGVAVQEYVPRHPVQGLEQVTFHVHFPKLEGRGGRRRIKLEIQRGPLGLASNTIRGKETLPLVVRKVKCLSRGALIGDKLTTLACNTIGVEIEELPKQLYDVANLTNGSKFSTKDVEDLLQAFEIVTKQQCGMKRIQHNLVGVLEDITLVLSKFVQREPGGRLNRETRQNIGSFASQYTSRVSGTDESAWETKVDVLERLVEGMKERFKSKISNEQLRAWINT